MTEKRFEYVYITDLGVNAIVDNATGKHIPLSNRIADKLNELNDKNELLAHNSEEYRKLSIHFEQRNNELISNNTFLEKENEQLKQTLRTYRKVANCRNCDYHDYDSREDGDDFEICEKGKDMENGICEEWREL